MGDSGGAKTSNKGTSSFKLPDWYSQDLRSISNSQQDYIKAAIHKADRGDYPSLYAALDPSTLAGLSMQENIARNGQVSPASQSEWLKTIQGQYLNPQTNPWLRDVADRAGYEAENRVNSQYAGAGRTGSGAWANALADAQVQGRNQLYADNYQNERQRMMQALGMSSQQSGLQYADALALQQAGNTRQADQLAKQQEAVRQYEMPISLNERYAAMLYGNPIQKEGTATTSQSSNQTNKFDWASFVGGLL